MRPKLFALLSVTTLALASCGASEPTETVAVTPSASAAGAELRPTGIEDITLDMDPVLKEETAFVFVAQKLASLYGAQEPDPEELIDSLHAFCDSGEPMAVISDDMVNESLEQTATNSTCEKVQK